MGGGGRRSSARTRCHGANKRSAQTQRAAAHSSQSISQGIEGEARSRRGARGRGESEARVAGCSGRAGRRAQRREAWCGAWQGHTEQQVGQHDEQHGEQRVEQHICLLAPSCCLWTPCCPTPQRWRGHRSRCPWSLCTVCIGPCERRRSRRVSRRQTFGLLLVDFSPS